MPATRHEPVRTCVGCREEAGKRALIRLVRGPDGAVRTDPTGRAQGRGAYLHADPACLALARSRRALERSLKVDVPAAFWEELTAER
jgi:predicted RNA-binding protein YlxR (DUF448 family)